MNAYISFKRNFHRSFLLATGVIALLSTVLSTPMPVQAAPGAVRYVSATGTVGSGTSCASPGFVGSSGTAIQAAINAANSGDAYCLVGNLTCRTIRISLHRDVVSP